MPDDDDVRAKKFVVDGIFPRNLVHLIAAPVGTGKTTLFMQQIYAMQNNLLFFGKKAYNSRIVYITADRGQQETEDTLERLGLPDLKIHLVSLKDDNYSTVPYLEYLLGKHCQAGDAVFVEPFNFFLLDDQKRPGDINNFGHVSRWLLKIGREASQRKITIEGSLHSSKAKQGSQYMVAREKVLGSVAWTAFTATTVVIEPTDPTVPEDPGRTIYVMPRNSRPFSLDYTVEPERGLLVPVIPTKPFRGKLETLLEEIDDQEFKVSDLAARAGVSQSTVYRWLDPKEEDGYVTKVAHGTYKKRQRV